MLGSSVEAGPVKFGSYMVIWEEFGPVKPVEMDRIFVACDHFSHLCVRSIPLFAG